MRSYYAEGCQNTCGGGDTWSDSLPATPTRQKASTAILAPALRHSPSLEMGDDTPGAAHVLWLLAQIHGALSLSPALGQSQRLNTTRGARYLWDHTASHRRSRIYPHL